MNKIELYKQAILLALDHPDMVVLYLTEAPNYTKEKIQVDIPDNLQIISYLDFLFNSKSKRYLNDKLLVVDNLKAFLDIQFKGRIRGYD